MTSVALTLSSCNNNHMADDPVKSTQIQERAQQLAYRAMNAYEDSERRRLARQALELHPCCVDALSVLASLEHDPKLCLEKLREAIDVATEELGGSVYIEENSGYFWGLLETRPYMRARCQYARMLVQARLVPAAIGELAEILDLCPDDNLGMRDLLLGCFLEVRDLPAARQLIKQHAADSSAAFAWGNLLEKLLSGNDVAAQHALDLARRVNPFAEDYLAGFRQLPIYLPDYHGVGDDNEAVLALQDIGSAWMGHMDAIAWLVRQQRQPKVPKVGRNEPCPCGSGLKYKKCCMGKPGLLSSRRGANAGNEEVLREVQRKLEGVDLDDQEALSRALVEAQQEIDARALDEFEGLSPAQMHRLLLEPFNAPELLEFHPVLPTEPDCMVAGLMRKLVEELGDDGLRATSKGNLPRATTISIARQVLGDTVFEEYFRYGSLRGEDDFRELQVTKLLAEQLSMIELSGRRWQLTDRCRELLAASGMRGIYPLLLEEYALRVDWGAWDLYPPLEILQDAFAFSLRLLATHGGDWRPDSFYSKRFALAFPMATELLHPGEYRSPAQVFNSIYRVRLLIRFAEFFGLVEVGGPFNMGHRILSDELQVHATPLLADVVAYRI